MPEDQSRVIRVYRQAPNQRKISSEFIGTSSYIKRRSAINSTIAFAVGIAFVSILFGLIEVGSSSSTIFPWKQNSAVSQFSITLLWSSAQLFRSLAGDNDIFGHIEHLCWSLWESMDVPKQKNISSLLNLPKLKFNCFENTSNLSTNCIEWSHLENNNGFDLSKPLLIPKIWDLQSNISHTTLNPISTEDLMEAPLGGLNIKYFTDASKRQALKPDNIAPLRNIVYNITKKNGTQKIGTQVPVERFPELISRVAPTQIVTRLFGNRFTPENLKRGLFGIPAWTTVPIFLARGLDQVDDSGYSINTTTLSLPSMSIRTELHCEPIGNIALQLQGRKLWTLVDPENWNRLRPGVSKHGRAFFYSALDTSLLIKSSIPYYQVITEEGDALWIPPWTWHRVDYLPDTVSLAASLFHFRPWEFVKNQPLFAFLLIPNLIKELVGSKTE